MNVNTVLQNIYINNLQNLYQEVTQVLRTPHFENTLEAKVAALSDFVLMNSDSLIIDLSNYNHHVQVYSDIKNAIQGQTTASVDKLIKKINSIEYSAKMLSLSQDFEKLTLFINQNQNEINLNSSDFQSNHENVIKAFKALKKDQDVAQEDFDSTLSKLLVRSLSLDSIEKVKAISTDQKVLGFAAACFVNVNRNPLKSLQLTIESLNEMAPYLDFVNFDEIPFNNINEAKKFLKSCVKATEMKIESKDLDELNDLPTTLKKLTFSKCPSLNSLDISKLTNLENLRLIHCKSVTNFNISNLANLKDLELYYCRSITNLNISNLTHLQKLDCILCTFLTSIDASNLPHLEELKFERNPRLATITSNGLPNCRRIEMTDCPRLRQLPQMPAHAEVFSNNIMIFRSFEVDPEDLENEPVKVLINLADVALNQKSIPNIVFLHSEGIDVGGLRRQLVTTLFKNLLQKTNSPLKLSEPEQSLEGVFPLLETYEEQSAKAYKALGRLIALANFGSLPLGRVLRQEFYYALLNLLPEIDSIDPTAPLPEPLKRKIYNLITLGYASDEEPSEKIPPFCLPIILAAKGFKEIVEESDLTTLLNPEKFNSFVTRVTGEEITLENFQRFSEYKSDEGNRLKGYFEQFFEKYKNNPKMLEDVVELFTSSRALGPEKIKIFVEKKMSKDALPTIATCFQQVELPPYESYELFEEKLLKTLEHTAGKFGTD